MWRVTVTASNSNYGHVIPGKFYGSIDIQSMLLKVQIDAFGLITAMLGWPQTPCFFVVNSRSVLLEIVHYWTLRILYIHTRTQQCWIHPIDKYFAMMYKTNSKPSRFRHPIVNRQMDRTRGRILTTSKKLKPTLTERFQIKIGLFVVIVQAE